MSDEAPYLAIRLEQALFELKGKKDTLMSDINHISKLAVVGEPIKGYFNVEKWVNMLDNLVLILNEVKKISATEHEATVFLNELSECLKKLEHAKANGNDTKEFLAAVNPQVVESWTNQINVIILKLKSKLRIAPVLYRLLSALRRAK